jgi:hypothetical protein
LTILRRNDRAGPQQAAEGLDTFQLTAGAYRVRRDRHGQRFVSDRQLVAVRRALAGLVREGIVVRLGTLRDRRCYWRLDPRHASYVGPDER